MGRVTATEMDEIIKFILDHYIFSATDWKQIKWMIAQHASYDTLMVVRESDDSIVAVGRWNVLPSGQDAVILDVIIHPDYRRKGLMHRMVQKGIQMFPKLKYLIYERHTKGKPFVKIPIRKLLKRRF